jgi:hypothetical protein
VYIAIDTIAEAEEKLLTQRTQCEFPSFGKRKDANLTMILERTRMAFSDHYYWYFLIYVGNDIAAEILTFSIDQLQYKKS